jgi:hypothetical protein
VIFFEMTIAILSNKLNNDLVDKIFTSVHNSYMEECIPGLINAPSVMDKIVKSPDGLTELIENHGVHITADMDWVDWAQVAIQFPSSRFIIWHDYADCPDYETILVEGFVENEKIKVERAHFEHRGEIEEVDVCRFYEIIKNHIPFQFYSRQYHDVNELLVDTSYVSGKKWSDPTSILSWFDKTNFRENENVSLL